MARDVAFLDDLGLADDQVSLDADDLQDRSEDFGTQLIGGNPPDAVVWPETTDDIATVLAACNDRGVPVTPYAAGTSLEGNPVPAKGGVSLDMTRMADVVDVRPDDFQVDVQPGIHGDDVDAAVADHDLFFPPLPQSAGIATIGGMIANDASGMRTVKYGEIRDWVLSLEAVLADGRVIRTGTRAVKTSAGYNLKDLIVGSEGTLAVVTEATLRLAKQPRVVMGGRALFPTLEEASGAVAATIQAGVDVATIELLDALSIEMANRYLDLDLPEEPGVFLAFHGPSRAGVRDEVERARALFEDHGLDSWEMGKSADEMETLWQARRELAYAILFYEPDLQPLHPGDITVPISQLTAVIRYAKELADEHDLLIPCFGHAGDGNVHYSVLVDPDDEDRSKVGREVYDRIVHKALKLGGTCTGEHGIGLGKQGYLRRELGDDAIDAMRAIKQAWDPNGILNPGKIFS